MRVRGNISPNSVSVENHVILPGYAEVRLRENISKITVEDTHTGETIIMYEYDEYTFCLKNYDGLKADIENNLSDWLTTGRNIEVNEQASSVQDMLSMFNRMGDLTPNVKSNSDSITDIQTALAEVYEMFLGGTQ